MEIKTPSGYIVHLRDYLTHIQKVELKKALVGGAKMSQNSDGMVVQEFDPLVMFEVEEKAFKMLAEKIVMDDQEYTQNLYKTLGEWREEDAEVVMDAVNEIARIQKQEDKKK